MSDITADTKTAKNGTTTKLATGEDTILHLLLTDIDVDPNWNNRSAVLTVAESTDGQRAGLSALVTGIFNDGQDEPIVVRSTKVDGFYKRTDKPWSLVAGFRRFAAVASLNANEQLLKLRAEEKKTVVPNTANGTIRAITKTLSEDAAIALNMRENTQRSDLTVYDLVHGAAKLAHLHQMDPKKIANTLGISPSHVALLIRVGSVRQDILTHWRTVGTTGKPATFNGITSDFIMTLTGLDDIGKADKKERQAEMYAKQLAEDLAEKAEDANAEGKSPGWYKASKKKAVAIATMLGMLAKESYGEKGDKYFVYVNEDVEWSSVVSKLVKAGKTKFSARQEKQLGEAMKTAYEEELEDMGDEEEETTPVADKGVAAPAKK